MRLQCDNLSGELQDQWSSSYKVPVAVQVRDSLQVSKIIINRYNVHCMSENISSNLMRHFTCLKSKIAEFGVDWFQIDYFTKQLRQAFFSSVKYCEGCHLIYCITQNYFTYLGKSSIFNRMLRCVKSHYSRIHKWSGLAQG